MIWTVPAILQRKGRFWVAEPMFAAPARGEGRDRRLAARLPLPSNRIAGKGGAAAREGDIVLVQLPKARHRRADARRGGARPELLRVIGRPEVASDVIEALMLNAGLRRGFPGSVEEEARQASRGGRARSGRRDLRELLTFTIDPRSAKDFDDAISAQRLGGGVARIWVHIADVAAYVTEGSALDEEARRRALSVYPPGAVEPMLPPALSEQACSLIPGEDRLAVTVEMTIEGAALRSSSFYRSVIRSDARLDYDRVDRIFAGSERAEGPWAEPLQTAREVAAALRAQREQRAGAITLNAAEPEFSFDATGQVTEITARIQTESHSLIEQLMIAANEAVAQHLQQRRVPCLYRVHEQPKPERVEALIDQLASLNVPTPPLAEGLSPSQAGDLIADASRLVEAHLRGAVARARAGDRSIPASGGRLALSALLLRALQQAAYSPRNIGHAGLGSTCYCHFTSPIRRYPDIICHRALLSSIGAGEQAPQASSLTELGVWVSEREREAMGIERDAGGVARAFALQSLLLEEGFDQPFDGEIVGLISAGAFAAFGPTVRSAPELGAAAPAFEGMLPVRTLRSADGERDWWTLNEQGTVLSGERTGRTLRLGSAVSVRVARVEPIRGRVDLMMLSAEMPAADRRALRC